MKAAKIMLIIMTAAYFGLLATDAAMRWMEARYRQANDGREIWTAVQVKVHALPHWRALELVAGAALLAALWSALS